MRLIDADALADALFEKRKNYPQWVAETIVSIPEAVVHCKDCKYRPTPPKAWGAEIDGQWCYWCEHHKSWEPDDWFCADGERKDGENNVPFSD